MRSLSILLLTVLGAAALAQSPAQPLTPASTPPGQEVFTEYLEQHRLQASDVLSQLPQPADFVADLLAATTRKEAIATLNRHVTSVYLPAFVEAGEAEIAPAPAAAPADTGLVAAIQAADLSRSPEASINAAAELGEEDPERTAGATLCLATVAGDWGTVGKILVEHPDEAAQAFSLLLSKLAEVKAPLLPGEAIDLLLVAPGPLSDEDIDALAGLYAPILDAPGASSFRRLLLNGTPQFGKDTPESRAQTAELLIRAGDPVAAVDFLPTLEQARTLDELEIYKRLLAYNLGLTVRLREGAALQEALDQAWTLARIVMDHPEADRLTRRRAFSDALTLMPSAPPDESAAWLASLFAGDGKQGDEAVYVLADKLAQEVANEAAPAARANSLLVLRNLVEAMLTHYDASSPTRRVQLGMLAQTLLVELERSADKAEPDIGARRKEHPYAAQRRRQQQGRGLQPVTLAGILPALPSPDWLEVMDPVTAARSYAAMLKVYGKTDQVALGLALLDEAARRLPGDGSRFAGALLSGWSEAIKGPPEPVEQNFYGGARYYLGGRQPLEQTTPVTRALQARRLDALSSMLALAEELGIEDIPATAKVDAFLAAHSSAEVYDTGDVERVFGPLPSLDPAMLTALVGAALQALDATWSDEEAQTAAKTNRDDKQIAEQIRLGYEFALALLDAIRTANPDVIEQPILEAQIHFTYANYLYEDDQIDYQELRRRRARCFELLQGAAEAYVRGACEGHIPVEPTRVYGPWFTLALGALNITDLSRETEPAPEQFPAIAASLEGFPERLHDLHKEELGDWLNAQLAACPEPARLMVTEAGLEVLGAHNAARLLERRKKLYYSLLDEVRLVVAPDGGTTVGHEQAFGIFLGLEFTHELGREGENFAKYLYNDVRDNFNDFAETDFRDRLSESIAKALGKSFTIEFIALYPAATTPIPAEQPGWLHKRLAYIAVVPNDRSVDRIPPIEMGLDFWDGYNDVVLNVYSPELVIDASAPTVARPLHGLEIDQTLDPRDLAEAGALLEIRVRAEGVAPAPDALLRLGDEPFPGFVVREVEKGPLEATGAERKDAGEPKPRPETVQLWKYTLGPAVGTAPSRFAFAAPTALADSAQVAYRVYTDTELVDTERVAALDPVGGLPWPWLVAAALAVAGLVWWKLRRSRQAEAAARQVDTNPYGLPAEITPFTAVGYLHRLRVERAGSLPAAEHSALATEIEALQEKFFAPDADPDDNPRAELEAVMARWAERAGLGAGRR